MPTWEDAEWEDDATKATGEQVYSIAITLIGQRSDNGSIPVAQTKTYLSKALHMLTLGQIELARAENITLTNPIVTSLLQELEISKITALSILPYFLAFNFLAEENPSLSNYFNQKFEELRKKIIQAPTTIIDVYNIGNTGGE